MSEDETESVLLTTEAVRETLNRIGVMLGQLDSYGKRTRQITIALILSLALDIVLTVVLGLVAFNSESTTSTVQSEFVAIHDIQVSNCTTSNQEKMDQIALWHEFITVAEEPAPGLPTPTKAEQQHSQQQITELFAFIGKTFAPVKCS